MGSWDYSLLEIGITEIMFEIRIMGFQSNTRWDFQTAVQPVNIFQTCQLPQYRWHSPDFGLLVPLSAHGDNDINVPIEDIVSYVPVFKFVKSDYY